MPSGPGYAGTLDAAVIFGVERDRRQRRGGAVSYLLLLRFVLFVPITLAGLVGPRRPLRGRRVRCTKATPGA